MAMAPAAGFSTGGSPASGMDSVKPTYPPLSRLGLASPRAWVTSGRNAGDSRALSVVGPPETFSASRRMLGSAPPSMVP